MQSWSLVIRFPISALNLPLRNISIQMEISARITVDPLASCAPFPYSVRSRRARGASAPLLWQSVTSRLRESAPLSGTPVYSCNVLRDHHRALPWLSYTLQCTIWHRNDAFCGVV